MSYAEICKKSSRKPFTAQHAGEWRANPSPRLSEAQFGKARPLAGNLLALWGIKAEPDPPQKQADKRFKKGQSSGRPRLFTLMTDGPLRCRSTCRDRIEEDGIEQGDIGQGDGCFEAQEG
jgi:hypothetical protein